MCGRFALAVDPNVLQQTFDLTSTPTLSARYNIAPTQPIQIITDAQPTALQSARWGLIPSWAKQIDMGSVLFNARGETLEEKPAFRTSFKRRRCLVPASGFYEWQAQLGSKSKTPIYIHLDQQDVFAFAGLWDTWTAPDGQIIQSCTIITTEPNDTLRPLHHRMAVILDRAEYGPWLSAEATPAELRAMIRSYPDGPIRTYAVGDAVSKVSYDGPLCIRPLSESDSPASGKDAGSGQLPLF
jgi:putative SOS response-associated peptidase YedK